MKKSQEFLYLDQQLCFKLYLASKTVTQAYGPMLKTLGLTYPQYLVMLVLWEAEPMSVKELGARLHLDSGTLSPLLKKLQDKKIVEKVRSREDERSVVISLTVGGKKLKEKAFSVQTNIRQEICLDDPNLMQLMTMLDSFTAGFHEK
ncbi:MAG: MarR family transcriptional regulator [Oligoflexus sp.]|nr:MarR family transcriptional regulator [Oligoflexus sp.]